MNRSRYIIYVAVPVLALLFCLLGWNCANVWKFESKQLQEKVESCIAEAADTILNYNGSLVNNFAAMLTDKEFKSKLAFAAGFTQNRSKISMTFFDEDKVPMPDSTPVISKKFLIENHIVSNPSSAMDIRHYDSVFKHQMIKNHVLVPYGLLLYKKGDAVLKDSIVSSRFIIDFSVPHVYCVHYLIPAVLVWKNIIPYVLSTLLLCALLLAGTVFYYRNYHTQVQLSQFRESLFSSVTHELKTPLSSMQLIIESAVKNMSTDQEVSVPSKHIQFAVTELHRMKLLVERILSFNKMNPEQFLLDKQKVDLGQIIADAIAIEDINIVAANATVTVEGQNNMIILGDPMLLTNAVAALIDNAIKYAQQAPMVKIALQKDAQFVTIAVVDNGIGIPKQYTRKVFQPFFRIPAGNLYNASGHGLGLSLVKQVAVLHGGDISVKSTEQGTTFYLKLNIS